MAVLSMVMCNQSLPSFGVRASTLDLSLHQSHNKPKDKLHQSQNKPKDKAVVILGTTGTGKSKLSLDLATHFNGEIISLDKMHVYQGFDIMSNKVTEEERGGVPHHLLDIVRSPIGDFTSNDYCNLAHVALESIVKRQCLPIIVGCTNSYMEALVDDKTLGFRQKYDCCYLWIDVALSVICQVLADRVDRMVEKGVVEEARQMFYANGADYSKGVLQTIGGKEFEHYFRVEASVDEETRARLMQEALSEMKINSGKLAQRQLGKILRLKYDKGLNIHSIDATNVYHKKGKKSQEITWNELVLGPSMDIVTQFLKGACVPN